MLFACYCVVLLGSFPSVLALLSDLISAKKDGNKKTEKKKIDYKNLNISVNNWN